MKRDFSLIRLILLEIESDTFVSFDQYKEYGHSSQAVGYHTDLLISAGFITGKILMATGGIYVRPGRLSLTWSGLDYLDNIRSKDVWAKVINALTNTVQTASMDVIAEISKRICLQALSDEITTR